MNLIKKLFGGGKTKSDDSAQANKDLSKYMPEVKLPSDESFITNFSKQGGRLLYSVSETEVQERFEDVMVEHDFFEREALSFDDKLTARFADYNVLYSKTNLLGSFFLTTCEYLIADTGAIMFSSNQIKEVKLQQLPEIFVVMASTSQIVTTVAEGLQGINRSGKKQLPSNITTLKNFQDRSQHTGDEDKNVLTYGAPHKLCYLILVEDL